MFGRHLPFAALLLVSSFSAVACTANADGEELSETSEANLGESTADAGTGDASTSDASTADASPPPSYDAIASLADDALRAKLYDLVKGHRSLGYSGARKVIFGRDAVGFQTPERKIECVYTGKLVTPTGSTSVEGFNTEHSWPQSLGAGSEPARSDIHHLFASDASANSARGSFPFGTPVCAHTEGMHCSFDRGGSFMGKDAQGHNTFEVRTKMRGDIARAHFYFAVRYQIHIPDYEESVLRAWSEEDVVDDSERRRNDAIEVVQHNRNPFVDRPDFVAKIADY